MWERDKGMEMEEQTDRDAEIPPSPSSYSTTTAAAAYKRSSSDVQLSVEEKRNGWICLYLKRTDPLRMKVWCRDTGSRLRIKVYWGSVLVGGTPNDTHRDYVLQSATQ